MKPRTASSPAPSHLPAWTIILLLFALSIVFRLPILDRPLAGNHEWLTSTVLRTLEIWNAEGAVNSHYLLPSMTYPGAANRFIPNHANLISSNGETFYTSYPSLGYYAPYAIFTALGVGPTLPAMRIFCLLIHLVCVCLIYRFARCVFEQHKPKEAEFGAVAAAAVYTLSSGTLWFHGNVYMSDMFAQPLFISGAMAGYQLINRSKPRIRDWCLLLFIVFALTLTEWIGGLLAISLALASYRFNGMRRGTLMMVLAGTGFGLVVLVTVTHYSSIDGFDHLLGSFRTKYEGYAPTADSTGTAAMLSPKRWLAVFWHYFYSYAGFACTGFGVLALLFLRSRKYLGQFIQEGLQNHSIILAIWLLGLPVLLHHLILFNWTASHSFSVLKTAPVLSLLLGLTIVWSFAVKPSLQDRGRAIPILLALLFLFGVSTSLFLYYRSNRMKDLNYLISGESIHRETSKDEMAFVSVGRLTPRRGLYWLVHPQLVYYAKRNLAVWLDATEAGRIMNLAGIKQGVIYNLNTDWEIESMRRFDDKELEKVDLWLKTSNR